MRRSTKKARKDIRDNLEDAEKEAIPNIRCVFINAETAM